MLANEFRIFCNHLVVHNYENIEISKNRPIGGLSNKKGMGLKSMKMP